MSTQKFDHPFFARVWTLKSARESQALRELRRENLAGLSGRVLEVGAGTGTNFGFYPETVCEVIALEPEPRLFVQAEHAANSATVPAWHAASNFSMESMPSRWCNAWIFLGPSPEIPSMAIRPGGMEAFNSS